MFNIALTGPYGSGKSSIIKSFLKRYKKYWFFKKPVLQISLAAFLPEADGSAATRSTPEKNNAAEEDGASGEKQKKGNVSKQEIERSILQQMLYGANANSLPLSRFKRIQKPRWWSRFVSLFLILGLSACWYLIQERSVILDGSYFQPFDHSNWFNLVCFALGFLFVWQTLHHIYIKSFGISLKTISLKEIELTPETAEEESILNRHLDEIIYFFQSTKYDLVIIEDLDRFNNPDVFVTLREINSLINANAGVNRHIRFLYALRDNMFVNTDRTKFFEFIVPVIPIINSSNSIDKVIEQSQRLSLYSRLDSQFLREVSRYLNDLRLIQNIFNEYSIYIKNLETDEENVLDPNRLLALLIYKNVLPSDFEDLHQEKGNLAEILNRRETLIINAEARYKAQISEIEHQISDSEKQIPSNLEELRNVYAMALVGKMPLNFTQIEFERDRTHIQTLASHQKFDEIIEAKIILCWSLQNQRQSLDISSLQTEVNPYKTYRERKEEIEYKSAGFKNSSSKKIRELRTKISTLRGAKFNEIIRADMNYIEPLFNKFGESCDLVKFLVFEGFLDDTYYQYTSLFHSGRLSPNDNKFLIQIRAFNNPEPNFQIDNPKEVIAAMRDDDFSQSFALNTILVDAMLSAPNDYAEQIAKFLDFITSKFEECNAFFIAYYQLGKCASELTSQLIEKWPGFVDAALQSSDGATHAARLLAHLPETRYKLLQKNGAGLSDFLSTRLYDVLELKIDFDPNRLKLLPLQIHELSSIQPYPVIARLITDEGQFKTSIENIEFAFREVLGLPNADQLETKHYSTILQCGSPVLIDKIENDFDYYVKYILLGLDNNTEEDASTIINVINRHEIESEHLVEFIVKQSAKIPSLEQVPSRLHSSVFKSQKIEALWENCLAFVQSKSFDADALTTFLEQDANLEELSKVIIDGKDSTLPLRQFIFENNGLKASSYKTYVRTLPSSFEQFPSKIDLEKLLILIEEQKVTFSKTAFDQLEEYSDYQVAFVAKNIEAYLSHKDQFPFDDDFREKLLNSDISDDQRLKVVADMDLSLIASQQTLASVIGGLFHRTGADIGHFSSEAARAVIINSTPAPIQISLLNMFQKSLSDEEVELVLHQMPEPFSDFEPGYKQPSLQDTETNRKLVEWLTERGIISSWKESIFGGIRVYNRRR